MCNKKIYINSEYIKLDSFLKFCGAFNTGGQAKVYIKDGKIKVNDEVTTMRGKKIYVGDYVCCENTVYEVCRE